MQHLCRGSSIILFGTQVGGAILLLLQFASPSYIRLFKLPRLLSDRLLQVTSCSAQRL